MERRERKGTMERERRICGAGDIKYKRLLSGKNSNKYIKKSRKIEGPESMF